MWVFYNPNPLGSNVGDCTVRAISRAMEQSWCKTYEDLAICGMQVCDMPSANNVWGAYLRKNGFCRSLIDDQGDDRYTVKDFCLDNPKGCYILAIQGHVVCVVDGDYYDSWDSGNEIPLYSWRKCKN